jgi:regulator of extracellular matrix RemA (YlzA/DUF370 family)
MKLIDIGFGNRLVAERILSVVHPNSLPIKNMIALAREQGLLVDATQGRKTQSVIVTDSSHVVLSYMAPERIVQAMEQEDENV